MTTLFDAFANFSIAVNVLASEIGDSIAYASYTRSIDLLQRKNELIPWYSWERYHNSREIQRLVRLKSDIDKRRATHESK